MAIIASGRLSFKFSPEIYSRARVLIASGGSALNSTENENRRQVEASIGFTLFAIQMTVHFALSKISLIRAFELFGEPDKPKKLEGAVDKSSSASSTTITESRLSVEAVTRERLKRSSPSRFSASF